MKNFFWCAIFFLAISILLASCEAVEEKQVLSAPTQICSVQLDWKGIIPGQSTQQDVIDRMGQPLEKGKEKFYKEEVRYFSYPIEGGIVKDLLKVDRVFFTSSGIVSWVEVVIADRDGKLHEVKDIADRLGYQLDSIFGNENFKPNSKTISEGGWFDVLGGPDQIYVWSHCGLAIIALPSCSPDPSGKIVCLEDPNTPTKPTQTLSALDEPPYHAGGEISTDPNSIILYQYFFPPTSYKDFKEYFWNKTAYHGWNFWDEFMKKYNLTSDSSIR
jgi:hypothetical protein